MDALDRVIERAPGIVSTLVALFLISALMIWGLASVYVFKRALGFDFVPDLDVLPDCEIEAFLEYARNLLNY
ncbi:hypothetical protein [Roseomonas sp. KE2513]|uniref:hypothetical protein n=1 Tax=Roseomonas sp. KE2513 TaxID=2479202 RepID=UPI001E3C730C|nr:hypothetical protein [Roseomonas sp. KE2513]